MNQSSWISLLLTHSYSKYHEYLWVSKKRFIADLCFPQHKHCILCAVILYNERRDLQFKVDSEQQIFKQLFIWILFTFRVFARNLLRGSRWRNIFFFIFHFIWDGWAEYKSHSLDECYMTKHEMFWTVLQHT